MLRSIRRSEAIKHVNDWTCLRRCRWYECSGMSRFSCIVIAFMGGINEVMYCCALSCFSYFIFPCFRYTDRPPNPCLRILMALHKLKALRKAFRCYPLTEKALLCLETMFSDDFREINLERRIFPLKSNHMIRLLLLPIIRIFQHASRSQS